MNISSLVVRTSPEYLEEVVESLNTSEHCDVHFQDEEGKIIVTIEGENIGDEMKKMAAIQKMAHVLSAELSYSYNEEDLSDAMERLENQESAVPDLLEEENPDVRKVNYSGRLKM
jgi:nitrate reductase NapD